MNIYFKKYILLNQKRFNTCIAKSDVHLVTLSKENYDEIFQNNNKIEDYKNKILLNYFGNC